MAKKSLFGAAQQPVEQPATGLALPTGSNMANVQVPERESYSNYVAFMHRDKGKWSDVKMKIPDLGDGDAVLFSDADPVKLSPLVFWLLDAMQYWCVKGGPPDYKPTKSWLTKPDDMKYNGARINETLSVMMLVQHGDEIIPATMRMQDAMCQGLYVAKDTAVVHAATPEWLRLSPDHTATASIPQPNLRFKTRLTWRPKKGRGGFTYFISSAEIIPTSAGDAGSFGSMTKDVELMEKVKLMQEAFNEHKTHIESLSK